METEEIKQLRKKLKRLKRNQFIFKAIAYIMACVGFVSIVIGMSVADENILTSAICIIVGAVCMAPFYILWEHGLV